MDFFGKKIISVTVAPEMQAMATENGCKTQSGYAAFESDGNKVIAVLINGMVNAIKYYQVKFFR